MKTLITNSIILLLLFAGCSVESDTSDELPDWDEHHPVPDILDLELELDIPHEVERGEDVVFTLTITHTGTTDVEIEGGDGPESFAFDHRMGYHDFIVTDPNNTLFWRFHHPPNVTVRDDRGHTLQLEKGESLSSTFTWDGKDLNGDFLKPGKYTVTGLYEVGAVLKDGQIIVGKNGAGNGELKFNHFTTQPKELMVK